FGAALAGADYVVMGAGIPRDIPQLLTDLAAGREGKIVADVAGGSITRYISVDPVDLLGDELPAIERPDFLAIVSADALAGYLYRDESIRPDGFIVEGPSAGGHSAPPRGRMQLDDAGEPIYGARDIVNLQKMADLTLPFWLAGAYGTPDKVAEALADGATGVQVGTLFALSLDSGLEGDTRAQMIKELGEGELTVRNDPRASPTGFPFKVASLEGTQSEQEVYEDRPRLCDLSYLRSAYEKDNGDVGYRCPSEPVHMYLKKGGTPEATKDRKCLCNGLMANIGLGQTRKDGYAETRIVTLGQDLAGAEMLIAQHEQGWSAEQAVEWLTSSLPAEQGQASDDRVPSLA
ncbi:MAG: nitronate monooxygenase, partial [Ornithinimicrobium sp.]